MRALMMIVLLAAATSAVAQTAPATRPAEPKRYVVGVDGRPASPRVAADNICAWPNLTRLRDGTITAIVFNQPDHAMAVGDVDCWASTDDGQTWTRRSTVAAHEPGTLTNRMNVAAGLATNGDLLVLSSGWQLRPDEKQQGKLALVKTLPICICRSSDGGRTWTVDHAGFPQASPDGDALVPHGNIMAGQDGALRVAAYVSRPGKSPRWRNAFAYRSDDDGRTWTTPHRLDANRLMNETFIFHAGGGRWLAAARTSRQLELYRSADDATTWAHNGPLTGEAAYPGHFMRLADGRILFSNGNRTRGDRHVEVRVSADEGKTWSDVRRIVDFGTSDDSYPNYDGGYPSCVQLPDGRVVTAYYARKTSYHDGYHMGVVTWDPATTFPMK